MLKFSTREDVETLQTTIGVEVIKLRQYADDWGNHFENKLTNYDDKFKEYLLVDDFQNLFVKITEDIKGQEASHRAKKPQTWRKQ